MLNPKIHFPYIKPPILTPKPILIGQVPPVSRELEVSLCNDILMDSLKSAYNETCSSKKNIFPNPKYEIPL